MWLKKITNALSCEILDTIKATKVIDSKIDKINNDGLDADDKRKDLPLDLIQKHAEYDIERLRIIEDKAKVTTAGITIALALFVAGIGRLSTKAAAMTLQYKLTEYILDIAIISTALFFLLAGYYSLKALRVKPIFRFSLKDELTFESEEQKRARSLEILDLNRHLVTKYTNFVEVSYNAVRNGIVTIAIAIIISTITGYLSESPLNDKKEIPECNLIIYNKHGNTTTISYDTKLVLDSSCHTK